MKNYKTTDILKKAKTFDSIIKADYYIDSLKYNKQTLLFTAIQIHGNIDKSIVIEIYNRVTNTFICFVRSSGLCKGIKKNLSTFKLQETVNQYLKAIQKDYDIKDIKTARNILAYHMTKNGMRNDKEIKTLINNLSD